MTSKNQMITKDTIKKQVAWSTKVLIKKIQWTQCQWVGISSSSISRTLVVRNQSKVKRENWCIDISTKPSLQSRWRLSTLVWWIFNGVGEDTWFASHLLSSWVMNQLNTGTSKTNWTTKDKSCGTMKRITLFWMLKEMAQFRFISLALLLWTLVSFIAILKVCTRSIKQTGLILKPKLIDLKNYLFTLVMKLTNFQVPRKDPIKKHTKIVECWRQSRN